uniref:Uncharacterized protein n=1 Tax=Anguilla anguilla TaxID=7936 RepID=A0A0E9XB99_ANGAN
MCMYVCACTVLTVLSVNNNVFCNVFLCITVTYKCSRSRVWQYHRALQSEVYSGRCSDEDYVLYYLMYIMYFTI